MHVHACIDPRTRHDPPSNPHVTPPAPPPQMAGSELVGPEVRQQVGQTILMLQRGGGGGGGVMVPPGAAAALPEADFAAAAAGLGPERKSWLDAAAAEYTALCHRV